MRGTGRRRRRPSRPGGGSCCVTVHGMDIGKWLAKQPKPEVWQTLTEGQRQRLEAIGVVPLAPPAEPKAPATRPDCLERL
ncbi:helicase associated domain-containing protein [Streptomyces sp. G5(2025)]|uniref:helicase associated domain-containing protein n=1 Tax=Streptomyces sp. G5(2025) TaxID=3406628 RepID=UPI003C148F6B